MSSKVTIYSDGGADPNPGRGGWAAILRSGGKEMVISGNDPATTNNRMELAAAIAALEALTKPSAVEFHTDSEYLRKGITEWIEGWEARHWKNKAGKAISNADLWQQLLPLVRKHSVTWHWVKGHSGDPLNERVDQLAREARSLIMPDKALADDGMRLFVRASCKGNPGPGGWGAVLISNGESVQNSGSELETTNNRMELLAVINGLKMVRPGHALQVFTASDYVYQGMTRWIHSWRARGWQKQDGRQVSNSDLWKMLDQVSNDYLIEWVNAKGIMLEELEVASRLAREARDLS